MKQSVINHLYGLIGYPLSHSFSKKYFNEKFEKEGLKGCHYELFPLKGIELLPGLIESRPNLRGLNVTIPHKQAVIPFLDELDAGAEAVGAVNTIRIEEDCLKGYNTDIYGFKWSLKGFLKKNEIEEESWKDIKSLILGTGGAAKAVAYVFKNMGIIHKFVSRKRERGDMTYHDLDQRIMGEHLLIINTSPLGMAPDIDKFPNIPYNYLNKRHLAYDLVYNPQKTEFLTKAEKQGCNILNGLNMLYLQAEKAWKVWN